jgi:hypothetical protein
VNWLSWFDFVRLLLHVDHIILDIHRVVLRVVRQVERVIAIYLVLVRVTCVDERRASVLYFIAFP